MTLACERVGTGRRTTNPGEVIAEMAVTKGVLPESYPVPTGALGELLCRVYLIDLVMASRQTL